MEIFEAVWVQSNIAGIAAINGVGFADLASGPFGSSIASDHMFDSSKFGGLVQMHIFGKKRKNDTSSESEIPRKLAIGASLFVQLPRICACQIQHPGKNFPVPLSNPDAASVRTDGLVHQVDAAHMTVVHVNY